MTVLAAVLAAVAAATVTWALLAGPLIALRDRVAELERDTGVQAGEIRRAGDLVDRLRAERDDAVAALARERAARQVDVTALAEDARRAREDGCRAVTLLVDTVERERAEAGQLFLALLVAWSASVQARRVRGAQYWAVLDALAEQDLRLTAGRDGRRALTAGGAR